MPPTSQRALLVAHPEDVDRVARGEHGDAVPVAGTLHLSKLLAARGVAAVPASDLLGENDKLAVLEEVCALAADLAAADWDGVPLELAAVVQAHLVRSAFTRSAYARAETSAGGPLLRFGAGGRSERAHDHVAVTVEDFVTPGRTHAAQAPVASSLRALKNTTFDLRSSSGLKLDDHSGEVLRRLVVTRKPDWHNRIKNVVATLRGGPVRKFRFRAARLDPVAPSILPPSFDGGSLGSAIDADLAARIEESFLAHRSAMRDVLRKAGRPDRALFNHVGNPRLAGYVAAFAEAGVPCEMSAHGCLVRTQEWPRDHVANALGPAIYNSFPGMTRIKPRSPLQAADRWPGQEIVSRVRTSSRPERSSDAPFRVLHAPNFLSWPVCYHGFAIDCFQTFQAVAALAKSVSAMSDVELDIRIKATTRDQARQGDGAARGMLPDDVLELVDPSRGVHDASWASHAETMARADLVVTEGITAVIFEALELRVPVLLLGARGLPPTLPSVPAKALHEGAGRAPVYAATPHDDLPAILRAIRAAHMGRPLTDAELERYVWV